MQQYQQVTPEQLQQADDGMTWDLTVDVESLSGQLLLIDDSTLSRLRRAQPQLGAAEHVVGRVPGMMLLRLPSAAGSG